MLYVHLDFVKKQTYICFTRAETVERSFIGTLLSCDLKSVKMRTVKWVRVRIFVLTNLKQLATCLCKTMVVIEKDLHWDRIKPEAKNHSGRTDDSDQV